MSQPNYTFLERRSVRQREIHLPKRKLRKIAGPALAAALFILAIQLLAREAKSISWDDFVAGMTGVPKVYLAFAAMLITLNYILLIAYDLLAKLIRDTT